VPKLLVFVVFDPVSNTRLEWPIGENGYFGITVKNAIGQLINTIALKTGKHPAQIMTSSDAQRFVLRVEPKGKGEHQ
jgi:hypothetical protein